MKNKLFLIAIALCAGLQVNMSFASEKQSWADWFRAKFTAAREKAPSVGATTLGVMATAPALEMALRVIPLSSGSIQQYFFIIGSFAAIYSTLGLAIDKYISNYQQGSDSRMDAVNKIKNDLTFVIANPLLYPTRSSKINALLKKDEFLQYINDQDGLVQEACAALSKEISSMTYSEEQRMMDRAIDAKMAEARKIISSYETLDDQIKVLEDYSNQTQKFGIFGMQAYLSVYFRLKNKQTIESKLSPEEQALRQARREESVKEVKAAYTVSEPSVD